METKGRNANTSLEVIQTYAQLNDIICFDNYHERLFDMRAVWDE